MLDTSARFVVFVLLIVFSPYFFVSNIYVIGLSPVASLVCSFCLASCSLSAISYSMTFLFSARSFSIFARSFSISAICSRLYRRNN